MLFWLISGGIALAVTVILSGALRARGDGEGMSAADSDMAVYRDQLSEIDRDVARGVLTEAEAATVRVEVSRRLLEADKRAAPASATRRGAFAPGAVLTFAVIALGGLGLYAWIGAPGYSDQPLANRLEMAAERLENRPSQEEAEAAAAAFLPAPPEITGEFADLMARLRAALQERPDDIQGLRLLAENEARMGNYGAARQAQEQLVDVQSDAAPVEERLALLDLMVFAAGGLVTAEAEARLAQIEKVAPDLGEVRYYRGLIAAQNGRPDIAFPIWRRLLETSPEGAPWVPVIRAEIRAVAAAAGVDYVPPSTRGPSAADIAAASEMSAEDRAEMVRGMVAGLSDRLATDGGPPSDWAQLIRALGVLGQAERAAQIGAEAEEAFAADEDALRMIRLAVRDAVQAASGANQ
jgi:cytochrome c-type biogenesis protein CcmH